ncbi:MAG: RsmD family RNA methyltransferase, partial [Coriobacteriia bacterium]|nr:RsmD family RNA methyltransferase [Coriobacteriia bacterium]
KNQLKLGMHPQGSHLPAPIDRCLLLSQDLSGLPETLRGALSYALAREPIQPYRAAIRHSQRTNQTELALWSLPSAMRRAFVAKLLAQAAPFDSIVRVLTGSDGAERDVRRTEVLHGRGHWTESLARERFTVSAPSFFQVNTEVAEAMVAAVLSLAGAEGHALARLHIWDLYSGVGSFTLPLAAAGATVSAVEWEGSSIRDLRRNLDLAGLTDSVDVLPGDVARVITELADQGNLEPPDLIIVDPPAAGMTQDVITALAQTKATRLIYVSCDPQTLARDTARLQAQAFKFNHAQLFDLFPQTYHVETIALFQR